MERLPIAVRGFAVDTVKGHPESVQASEAAEPGDLSERIVRAGEQGSGNRIEFKKLARVFEGDETSGASAFPRLPAEDTRDSP